MSTNGTHNEASNGSGDLVVPLQIYGNEVKTNTTFDVVNPSSGKVIWKAASASKEDVLKAVEAAQAAFPAWSKTKPSKRRDILLKAADILASRSEELGKYMMDETGSGEAFAGGFNIPTSVEMLKDIAGRIITISGSVPACGEDGKSAIIYKEPYGVVLGIAPWYGTRANCPSILRTKICIIPGTLPTSWAFEP
jgi:acyl-CoA reductase-like NAD-dependent aldehyde dehydrogenase